MVECWVVLETEDHQIKEASLEVLSEARKLARSSHGMLTVFSPESGGEINKTVQSFSPDLLMIPGVKEPFPTTEAVAGLLAMEINRKKPGIVLAAETIFGHDVISKLSVKMGLPFFPDCVGIAWDQQKEKPVVERFWYHDRISALMTGNGTMLATLRSGLFNVKNETSASQPKTEILGEWPLEEAGLKIIDFIKADPRQVDITDADILVTGGRGLQTPENFEMLWELADLIGGAVGGSRIARDNGWISLDRQIGQTGKTVAPKLIICCGISGATQHTFGMKEAKTIVVINKDKNAPIFKMADISIVGDVKEVLPALIKSIKEKKTKDLLREVK